MFYKIYICFLIHLSIIGTKCIEPEVETTQGILRGTTRFNKDGGIYYSFQNIPFGKPPIGELRFKAPEPAEGWDGVRDATEDLPQCVQAALGTIGISGQEDCLYLNIYTPGLPVENVTHKAVMVFMYGGAFTSGSAVESNYGGQFLLTKDVILVVFNYRVGIFGFLTLDNPDLGVPGNAGLKDQVLALKWINENIENFGGDPDNIMIFGQSAGAMSVHLHLLSPMSKGLFSKAIAESGVAVSPISGTRNNGVLIAETLGIETNNWKDMLTSLQNTSTETLFFGEQVLTVTYPYISRPIREITSVVPSFIQENPVDIIKSGNYNHVPLIIGINDAEGLLLQLISRLTTGQSVLITDFTTYIPDDLLISPGSEEEKVLSEEIKYFYYGDKEPNRDNITGAVNLYRDYAFAFPAYRSTLEHLETSLYPIYFYYFTADTELNLAKFLDVTTAVYPGAAHSDELGYLFHNLLTPSDIEEESAGGVILKNMIDLWTNFAKYDNPTPDNFENYEWDPVVLNQFNYLHIGTEEIYMDIDPIPENLQFWTNIYQKYFQQNK